MAGHSHAANVKHRKNAVDAKRAKIFSKAARNIISAVRQAGSEMDTNLKLKYAVEKARAANMPKDNILRAIKRGEGSKDGDDFEELVYEGYAPGGVAMLITCLTDNRNRTAPDIKFALEKGGGNMGSTGSVSFMFDFRSIFVVDMTGEQGEEGFAGKAFTEDSLLEVGMEAGAEDVQVEGDVATVFAAATEFLSVKTALEEAGVVMLSAETGYVPQTTVEVPTKEDAAKILKLIDKLEDNEDVQNVYSNYDIKDEWLEELNS
ncbi:putative transcriptional regulatory protein [Planctomycetes bacterium Poly30]|uniref:Probable transcriptional regulatory protein Poly30_31920 n=1 Tax=Saltatorellus ferox TaxID=2528018 RepID=A0A518EUC0_9BACT|nr:putative transcriptional regulatory protein [Planctomycetes bacterium Poly30]